MRRRSRSFVLILIVAAALVGCGEDETPRVLSFPNEPGGNPLVPEKALFPFPSDFYLEEDADTPTGRRLAIPQEALPDPLEAAAVVADGFTMMPSILVKLPGGIDLASLPDPADTAATTRDDSPVFLVEVGSWERVAALAHGALRQPGSQRAHRVDSAHGGRKARHA
jgi:hypothetical protein